jgi:hypothetical protein
VPPFKSYTISNHTSPAIAGFFIRVPQTGYRSAFTVFSKGVFKKIPFKNLHKNHTGNVKEMRSRYFIPDKEQNRK